MLLIAAAISSIVLAGAIYQIIGRARDARRYPPIGRLVDIGGRRLHVVESGEGSPAVILEAGIAASSLSWSLVQPEVAKFARVCSYDRAGLGWSDPDREPRQLERSVDDLHSLLAAASVAAPYVLVGHSYGGLLVRAFAARYPEQVAGIVLVDPVSIREWSDPSAARRRMLERGVRLSRRGAFMARFGLVRFALALLLAGGNRLPRLIARMASGRGESVASRLVGEVNKLPAQCWPMVRAHWCDPKCFAGMAGYLECLPPNARAVSRMGELPAVPLVILSAANATPAEIEEREELVRAVPAASHWIAVRSGHWIPFDEPELIVSAVWKVVDQTRSRTSC